MDLIGIVVAVILGLILLGVIIFIILDNLILPKIYEMRDNKYWASDKPDPRLKEYYNKYGWSKNVPRCRTWTKAPPMKG